MSPSDRVDIGPLREAVGLALGNVDVGSYVGSAHFFASLLKPRINLNEFVIADAFGWPTTLAPVVCVDEVFHAFPFRLNDWSTQTESWLPRRVPSEWRVLAATKHQT